jgi:hypothetical protein
MPRHNAAEAMPMPEPQEEKQPELEELPSDLLKEEPPPIPETQDMKEAREMLKELDETRDAALAAEERRKIMEARDKAATERMRRTMGAAPLHDLSDEAQLIEPPPIPSADKGWSARAAADIESKKKAKDEEKRKNWPKWMKKLWDALG